MSFVKILLCLSCCILWNLTSVDAKVVIIFYDEIHKCENFCTDEEYYEFYDLSTMRIILDEKDETVAYLNGTWKFNTDVKSPEKALAWAEKRYGSTWSKEAFYRRYKDACKDFNNPLDPVYVFFKDKKSCPHKKGDEISWNMQKMLLPPTILPSFIGEWRANLAVERMVDGKLRKQCKSFRYDIHEVSG